MPDIKINEFTAGGVSVLKKELSDNVAKKILRELASAIREKTFFQISDLKNQKTEDVLGEKTGMWKVVEQSIYKLAYNSKLKSAVENFDFSLKGQLDHLRDKYDLLLICSGENNIWTTGRAVMSFFRAVNSRLVVIPSPLSI